MWAILDLNSPTIAEPLKNGLRQRAILGSTIVRRTSRLYLRVLGEIKKIPCDTESLKTWAILDLN